jgi:hypothetical protein
VLVPPPPQRARLDLDLENLRSAVERYRTFNDALEAHAFSRHYEALRLVRGGRA